MPSKLPPVAGNGAARMRAARIRNKVRYNQPITPEDAAWFADYEAAKGPAGAPTGSRGRSAHERKTVHIETERGAAEGEGSAAAIAAGMAAQAYAEGQREDSNSKIALEVYRAVVGDMREMMRELRKRAERDGDVVRTLLESVRSHYLERVELEADAIRAAAENKDSLQQLAEMLLPMIGVKLPGAQHGSAGPVNGKKPGG